jgi:hypothetical protein
MDESAVRTLLERAAADPAPPSRVDIAAARQRGRRRLRWHRAVLGAAPLAAAAAVALVVSGVIPASLGFGPGGPGLVLRPGKETPRSRFSPLQPYAAFGWLPGGFSAAAGAALGGPDQATTVSATLIAGDQATGRLVTLTVSAAGACRVTGAQRDRVLEGADPLPTFGAVTYPHGLSCNDDMAQRSVTPLRTAAPDVRGASAFYLPGGGLAWEYAPGSWAQLTPSTRGTSGRDRLRQSYEMATGWVTGPSIGAFPATVQSAANRALLRKIAERVSYGATAHVVFPFQLAALPAGWAVSTVGYAPSAGRLLGTGGLSAGPAYYPWALGVTAMRAGSEGRCTNNPGGSHPARIHGAPGGFYPQSVTPDAFACDVDGMYLTVDLSLHVPNTSRPVPGAASLGAPLTVARRLRLFGTNPAAWTARPVR